MEPEPWCGIRYDRGEGEEEVEGEEELTLTPHHTPSQSFDFIVWEKAYLDNIPAASSCNNAPPPYPNFDVYCAPGPPDFDASSICVHTPSSGPSSSVHSISPKLSLPQESLQEPLPLQIPSSTLLACRTDADLPPSLFADKQRSSADAGFTSLEEAVQSYARKHPYAIGSPSPIPQHHNNMAQCPQCRTSDTLVQLDIANYEAALLRRCYSQPGGGKFNGLSGVGFIKTPIVSKNGVAAADSAVSGSAQIYQNQQFYAVPVQLLPPPPARNHSKWSCFLASPGRRKRAQSGCESLQWAEISENATLDRLHLQQERRLRCCPVDIPPQPQNYKLLAPAASPHMLAGRHNPARWSNMHVDLGAIAPGSDQNSLSERSSDCDHHRDAGVAAQLSMSKIKLWGLHHRFKAFCRKLCSFCTL